MQEATMAAITTPEWWDAVQDFARVVRLHQAAIESGSKKDQRLHLAEAKKQVRLLASCPGVRLDDGYAKARLKTILD
jgi:hypothetical protein